MGVTPHGWHIPGTELPDDYDSSKLATQCGGPGWCGSCRAAYFQHVADTRVVIPHYWSTPTIPPAKKKRAGKIRGNKPHMVIVDEIVNWINPPRTPSAHYVIMGDGSVHDAFTGDILTKHANSTSAVEHPAHYNQYPVEVIDLAEEMSFNGGNAVKYITRAPFKGKELEDLDKALYYIKKEIKRIKRKQKKEAKA